MTSTLITAYVGQGLAASRPATPSIDTGAIAWYYATDTGVLSYYANSAWHTQSATDPSISPFTKVPTNPGFDPLFTGKSGAVTLSSSNKTATPASGSPYNHMFGTPAVYTGKVYFEIVPGSTSFTNIGLAGSAGHLKNGDGANLGEGVAAGQIGYQSGGAVKISEYGTTSFTLTTLDGWSATNRVAIAVDVDNALFWFKNITTSGNWNNNVSNNPATGVGGLDLSWAWAASSTRLLWPAMNSGSTSASSMYLKTADFTGSVPSGFSSWSSL